ncbi:hypothetical protein TB2_009011 [Malus domestica]
MLRGRYGHTRKDKIENEDIRVNYLHVTCRVVPDKSEVDMNELSFTELRDKLLALDPLDKDHVAKWVSETCFPAGTLAKPSMKDLEYIEGIKQLIEKNEIPAPAPIEQRWTACTKSPMSPASSTREDDIFSWVIS